MMREVWCGQGERQGMVWTRGHLGESKASTLADCLEYDFGSFILVRLLACLVTPRQIILNFSGVHGETIRHPKVRGSRGLQRLRSVAR